MQTAKQNSITVSNNVVEKSSLSVISEQEVFGKSFQIYGTFENPLILAKDVAKLIEYDWGSVNKMLKNLDDDEKVKNHYTSLGSEETKRFNFGTNEAWFITENGIYELMFLIKTEKAKEFKKEVKKILHDLRTGEKTIVKTSALKDFLQGDFVNDMKNNYELSAKIEGAKILREIGIEYEGKSKTYKQILDAHATKLIAGDFLLPLPKVEKKTYSAEEIGKELGISAQKVGRIANAHGLKTEQFGEWFKDKSKYSSKEVDSFRYFENIFDELKNYL